jgi:DNA-binding winged helix-turn-helix (wHTH) protein/pimeloyl-ACP methyl ester carboxylesterase
MGIYRFSAFTLDTQTYELRCDGKAIPVEPQVFSLLAHLIENRDRVVSKDELITVVWRGRVVSDATLSSRISAARLALHDTGKMQSIIRTIPRRGFRFVAKLSGVDENGESDMRRTGVGGYAQEKASAVAAKEHPFSRSDRQRAQFCLSKDGTKLAFATTGAGPPLVKTGHWLTHLEFDWHSPVWQPYLDELGRIFQVTRYDQRGNGLSDWSIMDFSFDRLIEDLEAVVEAAGLERFALYSLGAPISVAYAVRHPERVSHLILHGSYVRGRQCRESPEEKEQGEAMLTLIRHGWGKAGSPFVKALTSMYIPGGTTEQIDSLVQMQRQSTSPENAARLRAAIDQFDVTDLLEKITVPTLVIHARNDGVQPLEEGRKLSAGIQHSQFLMLDSANHVPLQNESAWDAFFRGLTNFVLK